MKKYIFCLILLSFFISSASAEDIWLNAWKQKKNQYDYNSPVEKPKSPSDYLIFQRSQRSPSAYQRMEGINNFFGTDFSPSDFILLERALQNGDSIH